MLKTIVRAALPLLAATAIAQAAERGPAGQITYVDQQAGRVLLDNASFYSPADIAGLHVGDLFAVSTGKTDLAMTDGKAGAASESTATGRVSYIDGTGRAFVVGNVMIHMPSGFDMARIHFGQRMDVVYTPAAGMNAAQRLAWSGKPMMEAAGQHTTGHITYIDQAGGTILVNNARLAVPITIDIGKLRVGDMIEAAFTEAAGTNIAIRIAVRA